ncbi:hypothetical protein QJQ45_020742 [Haematococcus lacustris]|nr:hypothetical protein QJQ45_020742 [Haematococcus lacustris]
MLAPFHTFDLFTLNTYYEFMTSRCVQIIQNNNENLHDFVLSPCAPLFVHLALKCVTESPEPLEGEGGLAA